MKYNGIEIAELKTTFIKNLPREMLVWNDNSIEPKVKTIVGACVNLKGDCWYIAHDDKLGIVKYKHCAEIPEEPKPRRATNRELAKWLAQGKGEWGKCVSCKIERAEISWWYEWGYESEYLQKEIKIRKWDDRDWHEPDVQYMGLEA